MKAAALVDHDEPIQIYSRWGWDNGVVPGTFSSDIEASKKSLAELKGLSARHPKMEVRLGHQR